MYRFSGILLYAFICMIFISSIGNKTFAQSAKSDFGQMIKVFSPSDKKAYDKLKKKEEKGKKESKKAQELIKKAHTLSKKKGSESKANKAKAKAVKQMLKTGEVFATINQGKFELFKANYSNASAKAVPENKEIAKELEQQAADMYAQSVTKRNELKGMKDADIAKVGAVLKEASDLEVSALEMQKMIYGVYFNPNAEKSKDDAAWEAAVQAHTLESYENYLKAFPDGKKKDLAEKEIARFKTEQSDAESWKKAQESNTISAYKTYINKNPKGKYVREAADRIEELQDLENASKTKDDPKTLTYKVQVMALTKSKVNEKQLQKKCKTTYPIEKISAEGYTKYQISGFKSLDEALKFKSGLKNIPDAFVIVYKSGVKITIEEAKNILNGR